MLIMTQERMRRERKPYIIALMPFKADFDDIYTLGIKPACEAAGGRCVRIDEEWFGGDIVSRLYTEISAADIVVSDVSDQNPNVFYETGYAHALGKPVILVTRTSDGTAFDLRQQQQIVYGSSIQSLRNTLENRVKFFLEHPEQADPTDPRGIPNLLGRWKSTWLSQEEGRYVENTEVITIRRQRAQNVYGDVVSDDQDMANCACDLKGTYIEGYLQLLWSPGANNSDLIDYGCYFLKRQSDGSFRGYAVGHFWNRDRVETYEQTVIRIKD
ncbi:hypothetical protein ELH44_37005 [Rhizobium ruizarguesonis]|uniref:hypothetical protein n=1 Tax=Rhizobium ruizarguesonis TaxID=2081791 RepID=UPI001031599C|nr:hypothetical protein [Rhizobium ruizarguesonis]TBB38561.1 hypothetical protein ELH44_37005 [Rhizobium ruizarguesonis]